MPEDKKIPAKKLKRVEVSFIYENEEGETQVTDLMMDDWMEPPMLLVRQHENIREVHEGGNVKFEKTGELRTVIVLDATYRRQLIVDPNG